MTKQDMDGRLTDRKIILPLNQTVFLPKTAMGVRYIDKVRATVFIDKVQRGDEKIWLRGFYELDLEYQGLEGRGLHKYRVMLPLKAELSTEWLGNLQYEAADLHAVVSRPALKILSPYVLEFAGTMRLEYVGEHLWQEDKLNHCPKPALSRRVWRSDVPMPDADSSDLRLESKIDRFFLGRQGDKPMLPRLVRMNEEPPSTEQPPRRQELPVWPGGGQVDDNMRSNNMKNDNVRNDEMRRTNAHQAGDEIAENMGRKLPVWQPQMIKAAPQNEEIGQVSDEKTPLELPVWRFTPKSQPIPAEETVAESQHEYRTWARIEDLNGQQVKTEENAAVEDVPENVAEKVAENIDETGAAAVVEKSVEKAMEKPVEKPVETIVHKKWENYRQTQEQIYAPSLGKNKFRSLLTGAALARMQARGESLQAEAKYADWPAELPTAAEKSIDLPESVAEKAAENVIDTVTENLIGTAAEVNTATIDERGEDTATDMSKKVLEDTQSEIKAETAAADVAQVNEVQEVATENAAEIEVETAEVEAEIANEVMAEQAAVESEVAETEEKVVAGEVTAEVIAKEAGEKAAETVAKIAVNEQPAVAEVLAAPDIKQGVQMVNNSGVRLRMAAARQSRPESKPVSAGRSNATITPGKGFAMKYYVVKAGDEPMGIALKHNVSLESLLAANRLQNGELPVGTVLRIPV